MRELRRGSCEDRESEIRNQIKMRREIDGNRKMRRERQKAKKRKMEICNSRRLYADLMFFSI